MNDPYAMLKPKDQNDNMKRFESFIEAPPQLPQVNRSPSAYSLLLRNGGDDGDGSIEIKILM